MLYYLYKLKDGRIIVLREEDTFTVLNPSQNYKTDLQIKLRCTKVCQLENGNIKCFASASSNGISFKNKDDNVYITY